MIRVDIVKRFRGFHLEVAFETAGEPMGILGASGCGKSMTLKCIAGIVSPDEGHISADGRVLYDSAAKVNLKPQQRRVGYLFQNYALFPNMTAAQNIACGAGMVKHADRAPIGEVIARFRLEGLADHYPHQLSGGQQQRVALARMLAAHPAVVLLDEPFSALDAHLREQMQLELATVLESEHNAIMVTHSRDEVYKLCGELMVMEDGRVVTKGGTKAMFRAPGEAQVARLTGCKNISRAERLDEYHVAALDWGITLRTAEPVGDDIRHVGLRAHDFAAVYDAEDARENLIPIHVVGRSEDPFEWNIIFKGSEDPAAQPLWWKYSKWLLQDLPPRLHIPPEELLLLTD